MNTRIIKESRALLSAFIGTLLFIALPYAIWGQEALGFSYLALGVGCAIMACSSFGNEWQQRTMLLVLAQPIARRVIWREKMLVLAVGLLLALGVLWLCLALAGGKSDVEFWTLVLLIPLCAFCGGPSQTLVTRNAIAGVTWTLGLPLAFLSITLLVTDWLSTSEIVRLAIGVLLLVAYCVLAYWRGYLRFQRLQLMESGSREIALPARWEGLLRAGLGAFVGRFRGAWAALIKKELRLQQVSLLCAGFFVMITIPGIVLFYLKTQWGSALLAADYTLYTLLLPFIVGAVAVAEERAWGVAEWHLSLPPSRRKQWLAKILTLLPFSLLLGLLMPLALLEITQVGPLAHQWPIWVREAFPALMVSQLLVTSLAMYTGSFSNSSLQAILSAIGLLLAMLLAVRFLGYLLGRVPEFVFPPSDSHVILWRFIALEILLLLGLMQRYAYQNFRRPHQSWRRITVQVGVVLILSGFLGLLISILLGMMR